jgi:hypothetical protein
MQTNQFRAPAPADDKWVWERPAAQSSPEEPVGATCRFCGEPIPAGRRQCARCSNEIASVKNAPVAPAPAADAAAPAAEAHGGAIYALEFPTRCPHCSSEIRTFRVFRLIRTQVSFTSTLPRKGYVIVCPDCDGLLSTELSGLI